MVFGPAVVSVGTALLLWVASVLAACPIMGFQPPGPQQRLEAIGTTEDLPAVLQRALTPEVDFQPIPVPGPHDWLTAHPEPGQTFDEFRRSQPNRPDTQHRVLYLQPLGGFPDQPNPSMERLREYAAGFFQVDVKVLAHETAHMFGLNHCIYFHCLMNGSNHLDESDHRPLHLCPVCLHKLQFSADFDVVKRYEAMARLHRQVGFEGEPGWISRRLQRIQAETSPGGVSARRD